MSSAHMSYQPWPLPCYSPWPTTLNSRALKRSLPDEDNEPSFTKRSHLEHWKTVHDDRDVFPKTKRRKTLFVPRSEDETLGAAASMIEDETAASMVIDLDTGEELFPYQDQSSNSAPVSEPESAVSEVGNVDFDDFLDVRGTCKPSEGKGQDDDGSQNTSLHDRALVLQRPRLPTITICPSLPPVSLPKNVTSSGRRNRPRSSEADGMEIDDDYRCNETQKAGTMVIYRPPFSLEPLDLDGVADGVRAMDLD